MSKKIGYICFMETKGSVAEYFERNYAKLQREYGRREMSVRRMASLLRVSRGFLSQLMNGKKDSMTYHTARYIADILNDYEIMDLLHYERPSSEEMLPGFPVWLRSALVDAKTKMAEAGNVPTPAEAGFKAASDRITALGISKDSPEALQIFIDEMSKAIIPKLS